MPSIDEALEISGTGSVEATAAQVASAVGSDGGVVDFARTLKIMQAGSKQVTGEDKG